MTISTDKLIELISDKSDLDKEDARSGLENLIGTIKQEVDKQGAYSIERMGVFKKEGGELVFEPYETLSAEINYKYSGMKPIEIMEANRKSALRKTKATPGESVQEEKQSTKKKTDKKEEKKVQTKSETPASAQKEHAKTGTKEKKKAKEENGKSKQSPASRSSAKGTGDSGKGRTKKQERKTEKTKPPKSASSAKSTKSTQRTKSKDETSTGKSKKGEKETDRSVKQVGTTSSPAIKKPSVQEKSKNDSVMDLVRTAGAVVLIALTVYFVYLLMGNIKPGADDGSGNGAEQAQVTRTEDAEGSNGKATGGDVSGKAEKEKSQSIEPRTVDKANQEIESSELDSEIEYSDISTSSYGLRGRPSELGMKGYTIVIYSFSKESNARKIENTLLNKGFRVIVNKANVNGKNVWRVGIGQFPTIRRAQNAAKQLPEPYNTKHFLKRINN